MAVVIEKDDSGYHLIPPRLLERWAQAWQDLAEAEDDIVGWLEQTNQYPPDSL
ncbi:hypothetical protein [Nonomuraea zeae]|uniref:hypothetical protein n=1 Tax=Nonomuraea zeae TaxID=1642303 RepID=UPI003620C40C